MLRVAIGAGGFGVIVGLVIGSFSASGIVDMTVSAGMLLVAWIIGIISIAVSEPVWGLPKKYRLLATVICSVGLGAVLVGVGYWQYKHFPTKEIKNARLEYNGMTTEKSKSDSKVIEIYPHLLNRGDKAARGNEMAFAHVVVEKRLDDVIEDKDMAIVQETADKMPIPPVTGNEIQPGENAFPADQARTITEEEWNEIGSGNKLLYIFINSKYTDETMQLGSYFISELCGFYHPATSSMTQCHSHNRVYRLN